jgi:hypothetical protein
MSSKSGDHKTNQGSLILSSKRFEFAPNTTARQRTAEEGHRSAEEMDIDTERGTMPAWNVIDVKHRLNEENLMPTFSTAKFSGEK